MKKIKKNIKGIVFATGSIVASLPVVGSLVQNQPENINLDKYNQSTTNNLADYEFEENSKFGTTTESTSFKDKKMYEDENFVRFSFEITSTADVSFDQYQFFFKLSDNNSNDNNAPIAKAIKLDKLDDESFKKITDSLDDVKVFYTESEKKYTTVDKKNSGSTKINFYKMKIDLAVRRDDLKDKFFVFEHKRANVTTTWNPDFALDGTDKNVKITSFKNKSNLDIELTSNNEVKANFTPPNKTTTPLLLASEIPKKDTPIYNFYYLDEENKKTEIQTSEKNTTQIPQTDKNIILKCDVIYNGNIRTSDNEIKIEKETLSKPIISKKITSKGVLLSIDKLEKNSNHEIEWQKQTGSSWEKLEGYQEDNSNNSILVPFSDVGVYRAKHYSSSMSQETFSNEIVINNNDQNKISYISSKAKNISTVNLSIPAIKKNKISQYFWLSSENQKDYKLIQKTSSNNIDISKIKNEQYVICVLLFDDNSYSITNPTLVNEIFEAQLKINILSSNLSLNIEEINFGDHINKDKISYILEATNSSKKGNWKKIKELKLINNQFDYRFEANGIYRVKMVYKDTTDVLFSNVVDLRLDHLPDLNIPSASINSIDKNSSVILMSTMIPVIIIVLISVIVFIIIQSNKRKKEDW